MGCAPEKTTYYKYNNLIAASLEEDVEPPKPIYTLVLLKFSVRYRALWALWFCMDIMS